MGLSKTGTTATAIALDLVGLRTAHDQGDQLGGECQAIANTLEDGYECLGRFYPNATWLITYSYDVSAWFRSLQGHLARTPYERVIQNETYLSCRVFGCRAALPEGSSRTDPRTSIRVDPRTHQVVAESEEALKELYSRYYERLFTFLRQNSRSYALVDVRAHRYDAVRELVHPNITIPFRALNTKDNPLVHSGNMLGRCHNPRAFFRTRGHPGCGHGIGLR